MTVYLLGAGPGDPGLLTVRGAEVMAGAEVVIYDRLSVGAVLDFAPDDAEVINVGKRPGEDRISQAEINDLLVHHGGAGRLVVRLKGGDPFVFARGGEEAAALAAAGVAYEILRAAKRHPQSRLVQLIVTPGLALQALTTRQPEPDQIEIAIAALDAVLDAEGEPASA